MSVSSFEKQYEWKTLFFFLQNFDDYLRVIFTIEIKCKNK